MIKVNCGDVEIEGRERILTAELMVLMKSFAEEILIPKWGSKEKAREKMEEIADRVFLRIGEVEG